MLAFNVATDFLETFGGILLSVRERVVYGYFFALQWLLLLLLLLLVLCIFFFVPIKEEYGCIPILF